ncbi:hypothetical protein ARHIZOSPH14_32660 [Agromyces rhizosphaerae]|uniref:DUF4304 domain-containing protein n=1 Tax=Agromyces rhizosphaerae TaxID=88374 RepID=A0A9W6FQG0_9MICO|nr:DUF4304 domain-containing protein [Agromyces rhizosphaerae]GLI29024.1 hypothetical protein ARHIZOSPH14_32660 [Agromyces rhizosphaerae]
MAEIVAEHAPELKRLGFRKRRYGFNRTAGDGLVHVVKFWMAPKEPPAWTEVPGLRERLYGHFCVEFGIYVPQMNRSGGPRGSWINEYNCQLRRGIADPETRPWWSLDDPRSSAAAGSALWTIGLPWFDALPDATAVLDAFGSPDGPPLGMSPAAALDIADLCRARGETERERRLLEAYVVEPVSRPHAPYLAAYLTERGHADLVPSIRTR